MSRGADAIVVGGGLIGCTLAAELAQRGLEVVVVADGCGPRTLAALADHPALSAIRSDARIGKERALRLGLERTRAEHVVLTDVSARFGPAELAPLLRALADPAVGAASSEDVPGQGPPGDGEAEYVGAEMALRRLESERGGLIGLSGGLFAARRELCLAIPDHASRDFAVALECHRRGLVALHVPGARARCAMPMDLREDFERRRRTFAHGMQTLWEYRELLAPSAGAMAFKLWSHKVLRWAAPGLALGATGGAALVVADPAALALAGSAALALGVPRSRGRALHVLAVNAALVAATLSFLRRRRVYEWRPTRRSPAT